MLERTYEYRLYPNTSQQKNFEKIADTTRALYNQMLRDRTAHFRETGTWKQLDPAPFVKGSLLMKDLEPSVISYTTNNLRKAYEHFLYIKKTRTDRFTEEALLKKENDPDYKLMDNDLIGYPKLKTKSSRESWDIGPDAVLVTPDRVYVPGIGNIKIKLHRPIPVTSKIRYYTILKRPSGHFFLLVHLLIPEPAVKPNPEKALGIALEPGKLAQCSDGKPVLFRHMTEAQEKRISTAYEKLCRKTPGSRQYEKQRQYLAALYEKRTNQRRDCLHKISRELVAKADFIVIEEPGVMRKKKKLEKNGTYSKVSDEAWWTFSEFVKYKTAEEGKRFWRAPGAVPARDACSVCGIITTKPRGQFWVCQNCGASMPACLNAARNLQIFGDMYIKDSSKEDE